MNTNSHTKIIATLGPATSTKDILRILIKEGVNVFRLNFSHSNKEEHLKRIISIKELNKELGTNISILADLQGPKLRVGEIENNNIELVEDEIITFVTNKCMGTKDHIYMSYQEFPEDVNPGEIILIDDGKLKLEITETNKTNTVKAKVIYGGSLSSNKGVNLPLTKVSLPCLTEEDIAYVVFAIKNGVNWLGLSFVRRASDIQTLKDLIKKEKGNISIIAKIEKPEALQELEQIIELADGIMVARGDLGVEVPFDEVPVLQKLIVAKCIKHSKPVIIATQMMESMITSFRPTRAEANDVANAVLDGADALMLSAETAVGKYPVETIRSMQQIIDYTEVEGNPYFKQHQPIEGSPTFLADSICFNASKMAQQVDAKAIITFTNSGYTALRVSSHRPKSKIYAFTNNILLIDKISLLWGVQPFYISDYNDFNKAIAESINILKLNNLLAKGDCVIHIGSNPLNVNIRTNMMSISYI